VLLFSAGAGEFRILPALIFTVGATGLYLFPLFRTARFLSSFAVLIAASALASIRFGDTSLHVPLIALSLCSYYVLLRLKDLTFVFRARWHHFFVLTTSYLVFVAILPSLVAPFGTLRFLAIFAALVILTLQLMREQRDHSVPYRYQQTFAFVISFLVVEILWAVTILPVGILNAASIGLITLFTATGFMFRYSAGDVTRQTIIRNTFVMVALIAVVLFATKWSIQ
jgi:hypothetical protein